MYSDHTFLYVLCNPPTNSEKYVLKSYVPIRSEQPSRSSCLICYVRTRSGYVPTRSTNEFEKKLRFPYVPTRSVQQYRKRLSVDKNYDDPFNSITKKCRGVQCTHPYWGIGGEGGGGGGDWNAERG